MGGVRVSVPGSLNHRFMLPLTTPSAPFPSASFWNSPPLRGLCMAPVTARAASRPAISIAPAPSSLIRSTSPRSPFFWRIRASPLGRATEGKAGQESTAQGSSERWPRIKGLRGVVGGSGRERSLRRDQQNCGGATRSHNSGKYRDRVLAKKGDMYRFERSGTCPLLLSAPIVGELPYLGLERGDILRPGARFWNSPWRGGAGGRRGCFQTGFWRRLIGCGMADLYRVMISAVRAAGSRRATVLLPRSQPPASPGLTRKTPSRRSAKGLWVCPKTMTS